MPLSTGIHHIATVTSDIERLIDFYESVFDASVIADLTEGGLRHAFIDLGGGVVLHPFAVPGADVDRYTGPSTSPPFCVATPSCWATMECGSRGVRPSAGRPMTIDTPHGLVPKSQSSAAISNSSNCRSPVIRWYSATR